jgi:competence protein CoiA
MHAKVSSRGSRFFAHDAACRKCPLNGETLDHRLLKSAIAAAVRLAGWRAELEAVGPGRRWRADVLAASLKAGAEWRNLRTQHDDDDTRARTDRYTDNGVEVVWVFNRPHFDDVPAVAVEVDQSNIRVSGPVARLTVGHCQPNSCVRYSDLPTRRPCPGHSRWEAVTFALEAFVGILCRGDMIVTALTPTDPAGGGRADGLMFAGFSVKGWWTSPSNLRRADAIRQAQAATDATVVAPRERIRQQRESRPTAD